MGLCATSRSLGLAVVIEGTPVVLEARRVSIRRSTTLAQFVEGHLRDHRPIVVAVVGGDELRRRLGELSAGDSVIELDVVQVASGLCVDPTRAAICRELARRHALIARRARFTCGVQSESARYHEAAVVAAGAALVVSYEFSRP